MTYFFNSHIWLYQYEVTVVELGRKEKFQGRASTDSLGETAFVRCTCSQLVEDVVSILLHSNTKQ